MREVPSMKSPTLAFILSVIPGLGQIYSGAVMRGVLILAGSLVCVANREVIPVPVLAFLVLFCAWEARMAAFKRNGRILARMPGGSGTKAKGASESDWMLWAGALIIALLYLWAPMSLGVTVEPWMAWVGFAAAFLLSLMLGKGAAAHQMKAVPVAKRAGKAKATEQQA
jgi:hypothetical protein